MRKAFARALVPLMIAATLGSSPPAQAAAPFDRKALRISTVKGTESIAPGRVRKLTVRCPDGTFLVHGGALFRRKSGGPEAGFAVKAWLLGTQRSGRAWSAIGYVNDNQERSFILEATVACTPKRLATRTITEPTTVPPNESGGASLACAAGEQVLGSAAWWSSTPSGPPVSTDRARVVSSGPTGTENSFFAGANFSDQTLYLIRTVVCTDKLRPMSVHVFSDGGAAAGDDAGTLRSAAQTCALDKAINGGAHFHLFGQNASASVAGAALLGASSYLPKRSGWFAYGDAFELGPQDIRLSTTVLCLA